MSRDDGREIADRVNADIEGVIKEYWSGAIRRGDKMLLTPRIKPGQKKATSSFVVDLKGSVRGRWYRHSQNVGGWGIELLFYGEYDRLPKDKSDWRDAFQLARKFLGIVEERQESPEDAAEREERRKREKEKRDEEARHEAAEKAKKDAQRTLSAADVWKGTVPLKGTLGEAYLLARGIPPIAEWPWNPDETLRFHPALDFELDRSVGLYPAIVGKVVDAFGKSTSVWQIFLQRDQPQKADLEPSPKVGRGPSKGGAVRIGGIGSWIGIAEGIESALGAWALEDFRRPVWASLSTSGMSSFEPPLEVERIMIHPDGDKGVLSNGRILDPPGIHAARTLQSRMKAISIRCQISEICLLGDALDLLQTKRKYEQKTEPVSP